MYENLEEQVMKKIEKEQKKEWNENEKREEKNKVNWLKGKLTKCKVNQPQLQFYFLIISLLLFFCLFSILHFILYLQIICVFQINKFIYTCIH